MGNVEHYAYAYVRAWGRILEWSQTEIDEMVDLAVANEAPATSVYYDGVAWVQLGDGMTTSPQLRDRLEREVIAQRRSG